MDLYFYCAGYNGMILRNTFLLDWFINSINEAARSMPECQLLKREKTIDEEVFFFNDFWRKIDYVII
jgi:hypothetical protein